MEQMISIWFRVRILDSEFREMKATRPRLSVIMPYVSFKIWDACYFGMVEALLGRLQYSWCCSFTRPCFSVHLYCCSTYTVAFLVLATLETCSSRCSKSSWQLLPFISTFFLIKMLLSQSQNNTKANRWTTLSWNPGPSRSYTHTKSRLI